jgi:hypothetical protein
MHSTRSKNVREVLGGRVGQFSRTHTFVSGNSVPSIARHVAGAFGFNPAFDRPDLYGASKRSEDSVCHIKVLVPMPIRSDPIIV